MLPTKGLYTDSSLIDQPPQTHRAAKNIVFTKLYGSILNEPGFEQTAFGYPNDVAKPIGITMFPDNSYVIYSDGYNGGKDRIGIVDINENYTDLIIDDILDFDINFPIRSSEIDYNYLQQRIISWTDKKKTRILNIDNIPFALNSDKSLVDTSNIIELEIFTSFLCPFISSTGTPNSGAVKSGNYSFAVAYENNDGTRTPYSVFQGNINITDDIITSGINKFDGITPGTLTSKSIQLSINNVDSRYDQLVLIGISRINNIVTAFEIKKIPTKTAVSTTINTSYIGTEVVTALDLSEVLTTRPLYKNSGCMTQLANILYHADLESEDEIDYQQYANNIRIFYNSKLVDIYDINNSHKNNAPVGFAHGGVYAFYIRLLLKNGSYTRAFHIPGRNNYVGENPRATSSIAASEGLSALKYQAEDTTNQGGHLYTTDSNGIIHVTSMSINTNMGFWENKDEKYPPDFSTLGNSNVRHHTFPTLRKCQQTHYSSITEFGTRKIDVLGIDVTNVVIPSNLNNQVVGWQILYAQRDYQNSNTFGSDILLYASAQTSDPNAIWSGGGNWNIDTRNSSGSTGGNLTMRTDYIRGHSLELLKDKPQLGSAGLYFDIEFKTRRDGLYNVFNYSNFNNTSSPPNIGGNLVQSGDNVGQNPGMLIDYSCTSTNTFPSNQILKSVTNFRYLPSGIIDGEIFTVKNEEAIHLKITNPTISPSIVRSKLNIGTISRDPQYPMNNAVDSGYEETYYITYKQIRDNLYANYDQQVLNATSFISTISNGNFSQFATNIYGGDTFVGLRSFISTSPFRDNDTAGNGGITIVRAHLAESRYNIGLRYEVSGDVTTKYYPKVNPFDFWTSPTVPNQDGVTVIFNMLGNPNGLGYSQDSNATNSLNQATIANPYQIFTNKFPYRVIRSGYAGTNPQSIRSWKTYLVNDKYEANRNKGKIVNLATMDDVLLIHHLYALFRTTGKEKILTSTTEIYLGTADIFQQQPKDQVPAKLGALGTQNIFSCISFKGGYFWINQQEGTSYLITSNSIDEISDNGNRIFFFENTKIDNTLPDNPFIGQGYTVGYDKLNNRIVISKRGGDNEFTKSYSLDYKFWASDHDYLPNYLFFNNNKMFGIGNNKIMICDSNTKKGQYFDNTIYPSYIDIVFNEDPKEDKLFVGAEWTSEVKDINDNLLMKKTLSHIQGTTSHQDSGLIVLKPFVSFGQDSNVRAIINKWHFNKLKNNSTDFTKKRPLRDKYAVIRFMFDNSPNLDLSQNSLYLYDFDIKARKAEL